MIILNFSHPLTTEQQKQIVEMTGQPLDRVIDIPSQIDNQQPLFPQIFAMTEAAGLSPQQWQGEEILVNPPALSASATALLAVLHGRMGYFPPVLRIRPVAGATPPRFEVAEVLNLHEFRNAARLQR